MATNKPDLKATVTVDTSQVKPALDKVDSALNNTAEAAKQASESLQGVNAADGIQKTDKAAEALAADLDRVAEASAGAATGMQRMRNTSQGLLDARVKLADIRLEFAKIKDAAIQSGKAVENSVRESYRKAMSTARTEVENQRNVLAKELANKPVEIPVKYVQQGRSDTQKKLDYDNLRVAPQATDIIVGLSTGQSPLTVLLQQGGQLRDVFGSFGGALGALGNFLKTLITPLSLVGAAVGVLVIGFVKGRQEATEFAKALALTNNAAGSSVDQLKNSAAAIDEVAGTYGNAAEALTQLASSGAVAQVQLQELALAAIRLQSAGGPAMEETIKNFVELGKDPVAASDRLGRQLGYLTAQQYAQIRSLKQAGEEAKAAALAQELYRQAVEGAATKIKDSLGTLERAAKATTGFFKEMWDAILGIGREDTLEQKLADAEKRLTNLSRYSTNPEDRFRKEAQAEVDALKEQVQLRNRAATAARDEQNKRIKERAEADRDFADRNERQLAVAKSANEKLLAELNNANDAIKVAYDNGLQSLGDYYTARNFIIEQQNAAEIKLLQANLAAAQSFLAKNPLDRGAQAAVTEARGAIDTAKVQGTGRVAQNTSDAAKAARDYAEAIDALNLKLQENAGLETSAEAARLRRAAAEAQYRTLLGQADTPEQRQSIQATVAAQVAVGELKAQQVQTERDLYTYTKQRADLELLAQNGQISQIEAQRELYGLELQRNAEYLTMLERMQQIANLPVEQQQALQQAIDAAKRGMEQLSPLAQQFNTTLRSGMEDAFAQAILQTRSLQDGLKAVAQQVAQIFAKRAAASIVSTFLPGFADGGYVRGPGTTTSDSIPALLSDREFVQPAHVVEHYGVNFMEALRKLQVPKIPATAVATSSQKLGRYAAGGLVGQSAVSAASGANIPVQVNIQNSGTGKTASSEAKFDGKNVVVSVLLDDIKNNGPIFSGLTSAQRLRR